ncbi:MAG: hypothetical protein ACR2MS_02220 [Weeksellaceae bacterium]
MSITKKSAFEDSLFWNEEASNACVVLEKQVLDFIKNNEDSFDYTSIMTMIHEAVATASLEHRINAQADMHKKLSDEKWGKS